MRTSYRTLWLAAALAAAMPVLAQPGRPQPVVSHRKSDTAARLPKALEGIGIDQKLNTRIPLDLAFRDEFGRPVRLANYFGQRPVLLALVYFECPMLCTQVLNGMVSSLRAVAFNPGKDFDVVVVSFDPKDTPELASAKKANYLRRYARPGTANGWHFLTGEEPSIKALTEAVGFHYRYDEGIKQFVHASAIYALTPEGRLSRYFYGVDYAPREVRWALVEASERKIGNPVDAVLLFCYHYDPATGKYGAVTMNIVRLGGATFVLIGGTFLFIMWKRDWRRDRESLRKAS
ncbi:MAG: SCO family protein [Bryobacteraceae bacterium]